MVRPRGSRGKSAGARAPRADQETRETPRLKARGAAAACFVYVLGCSDRHGLRTYVGWTNDLPRRIARHNAGKGARSTRGRAWYVLYAERFASKREAMRREYYLKRDRRFRKRLVLGMSLFSPNQQ